MLTAYEGYDPAGLGPSNVSLSGRYYYLGDRINTGSYTGSVKPALAVLSSDAWIYPTVERYLIVKVESGDSNPNFDIQVRFSLSGQGNDDTVWSDWENFLDDSGWTLKGIKIAQSLVDTSIGGTSKPGPKTLYAMFKRVVQPTSGVGTQTEYCIYDAQVYWSGQAPVITSVQIGYYLDI